jgi:colanic acid biosynthesis glycosyl transferase WcaI
MSITPVWADPDAIRPQAQQNHFRKRHCLEGRFVVMYAGTLGLTSALEDVLCAARILQNDPAIRFVLVGEGVKKEPLVQFAREESLDNVLFLPFQPRSEFSAMMAAADVSVVTLNSASSPFSLPNKVFSIMASGRPILAVTPHESEVAQLVRCGNCGVIVAPGEPQALAREILELKEQPERSVCLGRNGRSLLERRFSRCRCVDHYEQVFTQVLA